MEEGSIKSSANSKYTTFFSLLAHLPWKHQQPPTQLRATVNAEPAGTVKAGSSPQLLSPSLSCTLMKFSIQKGSQTQRLVNESQWPWSEQFNWHAASKEREAGPQESELEDDRLPGPRKTGRDPQITIMAACNWGRRKGSRLLLLAVFRISSSSLFFLIFFHISSS